MKLITLNIWGGKIYEPLMVFLRTHSKDTDIFCFQDILFGSKSEFTPLRQGRINIFAEIEIILSDFNSLIFRTPGESHFHDEILPKDIGCGQAIFVRKTLNILESGGFRGEGGIYEQDGTIVGGRYQWVKIGRKDDEITVMNVHGLWQKDSNKKDTPERTHQSHQIRKFLDFQVGKKIICGDLNLALDTESMKILEKGMVNLIKKYSVSSTRSSIYTKPEKFADYIIVSEDIKVDDFKVLQDEVSDHLPLSLDFE